MPCATGTFFESFFAGRLPALLLIVSCCLASSGCAYGILYSNVRQPLTINMKSTPFAPARGLSTTDSVRLPLTSLRLSAEWNSRAIADAAKAGGLEEIYFADLHTVSILLGLWREQTVEVYGSKPLIPN